MYVYFFFFFFSSRRRHTRCLSDWSSDVCSSDLDRAGHVRGIVGGEEEHDRRDVLRPRVARQRCRGEHGARLGKEIAKARRRSEERRVGKESRGRGETE